MTTATTTSADRITEEVVLTQPRHRVWRALTTASELGAWFGADLKGAEIATGVHVLGNMTIPNYTHLPFDVIVDEVTPETRFVWRWHPYAMDPALDYSTEPRTRVEFTLEDTAEGGTRVRVIESGFESLFENRRRIAFDANSGGWRGQLHKRLPAYLDAA